MYIFKKTLDKNNPHDISSVTVVIDNNEVTVSEMKEIFYDFLRGCGYIVDYEED